MMRHVHWPEFIRDWPKPLEGGLPVFLDLNLYDIPTTIRAAITVAAEMGVAKVSVHPSCYVPATEGQVDGKPEVIASDHVKDHL